MNEDEHACQLQKNKWNIKSFCLYLYTLGEGYGLDLWLLLLVFFLLKINLYY